MSPAPVAADAAPRRFAALHVADDRRYFVLGLMAMMADNIEHVISYWVPFLLFSVWAGALADGYDCGFAGVIIAPAAQLVVGAAIGARHPPRGPRRFSLGLTVSEHSVYLICPRSNPW